MNGQYPRVLVASVPAAAASRHYSATGSLKDKVIVKVLDTVGNELAFLDKHRTKLTALHVVEPVAVVRDFTPGLSAVVLPMLTSLATVPADVVKSVLPQLVQLVSVWRSRGLVHGDLKPRNLVVSETRPTPSLLYLSGTDKSTGKGASDVLSTGSRHGAGRGGGGIASETPVRVNRKSRERYLCLPVVARTE